MCKQRSVRICCHESPHVEAFGSCLRLFHTVSLGRWVHRPLFVLLGELLAPAVRVLPT
jgi:hypothetical protein